MKHLSTIAAAALATAGLLALAYHVGGAVTAERIEAAAASDRSAYADTLAAERAEIALRDTMIAQQADTIATERTATAAVVRTLRSALYSSRASEASALARLDSARTAADTLRAVPGLVAALRDCTFLRQTCEASIESYEDLTNSLDRGLALRDSQIVALRSSVSTARAALDSQALELASLQHAQGGSRGAPAASVGVGVLVSGVAEGSTQGRLVLSALWHVDAARIAGVRLLPPVTLQAAVPLPLDALILTAHVGL